MAWSSYAVGDEEADVIDGYRPGTRFAPARVQQLDQPGENLQSGFPPAEGYTLPDPAVGGVYGSKNRNAMTFGLVSTLRQRVRPFGGQVVRLPDTQANPVQGNVGRNQRHQAQLAAGVRDQHTTYTGSLKSFAESLKILGKLTPVGTDNSVATDETAIRPGG